MPYRARLIARLYVSTEINRRLRKNNIDPTASDWLSPFSVARNNRFAYMFRWVSETERSHDSRLVPTADSRYVE